MTKTTENHSRRISPYILAAGTCFHFWRPLARNAG